MKTLNFSSSFLRFIESNVRQSKICRILYGMGYKRYGYNSIDKFSGNILTSDEVNYLTNRKDGTISYLPKGKTHLVNEDNSWKKEGRQEGKPSKVIRKIFTPKFIKRCLKDSDFEQFANCYKSTFCEDGYYLELWDNTKIKTAYDMEVAEGGGTLQSSCMQGDSRYLGMYAGSKKVEILVLMKVGGEGRLYGRALIWDVDNLGGEKFMDRIYVTNDWQYQLFIDYAINNKFWRKEHYNTYDYKRHLITPIGETIMKTLRVELNTDWEYYPYIDTFTFGGEGYITNDEVNEYTYRETDGTRDGDAGGNTEYCDYNRTDYDRDEMCYIEYSSRYSLQYSDCYIHETDCINAIMPNNCEQLVCTHDNCIVEVVGRRRAYHEEHEDIIEVKGRYYHIEDDYVVYCEEEGEYLLADDCVYITEDGNYYSLDSGSIVEVEGCYETHYLKTNEELICIEGEFFHTKYHDGVEIISIEGADGEVIWYKLDCPYLTTIDGDLMDIRSTEYKELKKKYRRNRRNKLGRKNKSKKVIK